MEKVQIGKRGRKINEDMEDAVMSCIEDGLGYYTAVPRLIEMGFCDNAGKCTITQRKYYLAAHRNKEFKSLTINLHPESYDYAAEHKAEIEAIVEEYIKSKLAEQ